MHSYLAGVESKWDTVAKPQKIVLITGATSGIGMACAKIFAANGFDLILTGRRSERLHGLADELRGEFHRHVLSLVFDVRDREACREAIEGLPADWQAIEILVNNAGLALGRGSIAEGDLDDWETMLDTNVKGLLYITRLVAPGMAARQKGHILNISSIAGQEVYGGGNVYCASKFAVTALSHGMRLDLVEQGIRVTNISPGAVETEFSLVRFHGDQGQAEAVYDGFTPLTAEDIAGAVFWAANQPEHVNIDEITLTAKAQGRTRSVVRGKGF